MGMIRVSDEVESRLKGVSDGRSMSATVDMLLSGGTGGGLTTIINKLDYLENYLDKRLPKLESLIEDNLVDVVAAGRNSARNSHSTSPMDNDFLDWDVFRYIIFDLCKDDSSPEWVSPSIHDAMDNLSGPIDTIVLDGYIWAVNDYGKSKILKVSPRVEQAIREGRRYE